MRKLILISTALVFSTGFAFAASSISQSWTANPSITYLNKAHAFAGSFGKQVGVVDGSGSIKQTVTASPTISHLTKASATVITHVDQLGFIFP